MKKQILTLIIGILIGAIVATGVFLVLKENSSGDRMNMGEPPSMNGNAINGGRRPSGAQEDIEQNNNGNTRTTTYEQQ